MEDYIKLQEGEIFQEYSSISDAETDLKEVWFKNKPDYLIIDGRLYQKLKNPALMAIFKKLTDKEEKDFRSFVDEDETVKIFLKKANSWHPVIRDEICKRLMREND